MAISNPRDHDWILLPGTLCTDQVFGGFLDVLGVPVARRHPVALSLPNIQDYAAMLRTRADGAIVCGFSLGALVAAHLADQVNADEFVFFGLNPLPDDPDRAGGRRALARDVTTLGGAEAMRSRLPPMSGPNAIQAHAAVLAMADVAAPDIEAQTALALNRPGALAALAKSRAPVTILAGTEDLLTPPALGRMAADAAPRGQFIPLPGLGHYALLEDPDVCAQALLTPGDKRP
jgi:pimeloyl-ACP methyl ester carboxylesterase